VKSYNVFIIIINTPLRYNQIKQNTHATSDRAGTRGAEAPGQRFKNTLTRFV